MTASPSNPDPAANLGGRVSVASIRRWHEDTIGPLPTVTSTSAASREISFDLVLQRLYRVIARAERHGQLPTLGTPDWRDLDPNDPRAVGSVYVAALLWALHRENRQHAIDDAAEHLAGSGAASRAHRIRTDITEFYDSFPDLRRKAS